MRVWLIETNGLIGLLEVRCKLLMVVGMWRRRLGLRRPLCLVRCLCWLLGSS
jgi:hypothetical protein